MTRIEVHVFFQTVPLFIKLVESSATAKVLDKMFCDLSDLSYKGVLVVVI